MARRVIHRLEQPRHRGWLLVYDNASNEESIRGLLPARGGSKILITSRHTQWSGQCIAIEVFNLEETREYVRKITRLSEPALMDKLIATLGHLSLALPQAYAYTHHTSRREF